MSDQVYLGIDLGAESGRVMAGLWNGRTMRLEELHRFPNGPIEIAGTLRWDVLRLWAEIEQGLGRAAQRFGGQITSLGVDTWGVDYVLLSRRGELLGLPYNYRDPRTRGLLDAACERFGRAEIFAASGIQFMPINTLYQLIAARRDHPALLEVADCFLMIPDFLNWCLTGVHGVEFTNATTTQFVDPHRRTWSGALLDAFEIPTRLFPPIIAPGAALGGLRASVRRRTGLGAVEVIAPATHDTGSAVAGVPTAHTGRANWAYISSGTWSLMGVEVPQAILTPRALALNVTNEGGLEGTYRLLKNIMGLWLVQRCKRAFEAQGSTCDYAELVRLAEQARPFRSLIEPDDPRFLAPPDMPAAIREFCRESGQPAPEDEGALVRCCLESLALKYRIVLGWLEELTGERVEVIHVVGGGARNALLNQCTAEACQRPVLAGPVEATVLGNLLVQAHSGGEFASLGEMRLALAASETPVRYEPRGAAEWNAAAERFDRLSRK